jgi:hypothetical protein
MPKRRKAGRIHVSCWRGKWKGGVYESPEDAKRAIARHIECESHRRGVEATRRAAGVAGAPAEKRA